MDRSMCIENKVRESYDSFYSEQEAEALIKSSLGKDFDEAFYKRCRDILLFVFVSGSPVSKDSECKQKYLYMHKADLEICIHILRINSFVDYSEWYQFGYNGDLQSTHIKLSKATYLIFKETDLKRQIPAFVRNLFYFSEMKISDEEDEEISQFDLFGLSLLTKEKKIREYMTAVENRKTKLLSVKKSVFTASASYMGNKKRIIGFIVESMMPHIEEKTVFIDLMCGSGTVSNAFAQFGETYASDAQMFCRLLAKIQGGGYTCSRAKMVLEKILEKYKTNYLWLNREYASYLQEEDAIFHMDYSNMEGIFDRYQRFIENYPLYSSDKDSSSSWADSIVAEKRKIPKQLPYCLFTTYFANIYFGLEQCIQLDSLRYAIDQISDGKDREWALGVLIMVSYQIATGHAGHFAQPKKLTIKNIKSVLEKRQMPAKLEFSRRFLSLGEQSENYPNEIRTIDGPWKQALERMKPFVSLNSLVYLDAPYKRDEYSRYYHVLETMVKYDYPSSENKGHISSKSKGERFATEFFTKKTNQVENILADIIINILKQYPICVWSYSNNAAASIAKVIAMVEEHIKCSTYIYGTYHRHKSQRSKTHDRRKEIEVIEYSIVFSKKDRLDEW